MFMKPCVSVLALVLGMAVANTAACAGDQGGKSHVMGKARALDLVPFGEITRWDTEGKDYGAIWEDAREIHKVVVVFAKEPPPADAVALEYWQSSWPHRRIPRDAASGAGQSGWLDVGDWFQGEWKAADVDVAVDGLTYTYTFRPLNKREFPDLKDFAPTYRTTFKLRLAGQTPLPEVASFRAYSDSLLKPLDFEIEWRAPAKNGHERIEVFNGVLEKHEPMASGLRARVLSAETQRLNSFDETVVTVRDADQTFSFATADLIAWQHILIPDLGALVRLAGGDITYAAAERQCAEATHKDVYSRVLDSPEQTLPNAWTDIPAKGRHYIPLSFEGGRQHFGLNEHGNVFCNWRWLGRIKSTDTPRCLWDGDAIDYQFGLSASDLVERGLVDGCLPMMVSVWERDGVRYTQRVFVIPLAGAPGAGQRILAEDPLVLMVRFEMTLAGEAEAEARIDLDVRHGGKQERLAIAQNRILGAEKDPRQLRMVVSEAADLEQQDGRVSYRKALAANDAVRLDIAIPYITLTEPAQGEAWEQLRGLQFDDAFEAVRGYWRGRVSDGAQIETPEPMINDFYKAHAGHLLTNTEREVGGSDRYMAKVGTFSYGVYANESCMMVSDLDRRGYHERAEQALETWLHYQGSVGLPGDFSTAEGQFYGAGGYESGGYNQHHGWVLWCLGEHYWYTRDADWLAHAAPAIVKACDWIVHERQRVIEAADESPLRAIERGLLPPGRLEDIGDWRCWLSTNVYSWWGMDTAARALADAGRPEGKRLSDEARAYKQDLLAAYTEAMRRSPVVRLRDGSWIPHVPSDVHRRGRSFGWITETLEGAIHLVRCEAIDPLGRMATWIVKDFEDNLYISEQFGYNITGEEFERHWFSRGGISMQANLLCNPIPYLLRDEPKHFLRAYFNAFAVSYFPDTRMMTEHALPNIGDWRGDHYKSSDEANSTYWLRLMFVQERRDELWLGAAVPRYWLADGQRVGIYSAATYFGPTSVRIESHVSENRIEMTIDPPRRNPPRQIRARFRHPDAARMTRCEVDGAPHTAFDPDKEWVELTGCTGQTTVTAFYN